MGCDIHALIERKVGDKWIMVNRLEGKATDRNYQRFAALAGVRGQGPIPKGLPNDISDSGRLYADEWDGDAHSHSYMDLKEAISIFTDTVDFPNIPLEKKMEKKIRLPAFYFFDVDDYDIDKHRIVFWFDN